jgi:flagellar protein FliS
MAYPIHQDYRQAELLTSDPLKQVQILYRAAIDSVVAARRFVQQKDIAARSRSIMKAWSIVNELLHSLDHAAGGDLSRNLAALYTYMQTKLLEANTQQAEPPLAEVQHLLSTLLEGWSSAVLPATFVKDAVVDSGNAAGGINTDESSTRTQEYVPLNYSY